MGQGRSIDRTVLFVFLSVTLFLMLTAWLFFGNAEQTQAQNTILRTMFALAAAGVSASLASVVGAAVGIRHRMTLFATASVAIFVLTYFLFPSWKVPVEKLGAFASDHRSSLIAVGLGSAGVLSAIAGLLTTYLRARRASGTFKISVSSKDDPRTLVTFEINSLDSDAARQVLEALEQQIRRDRGDSAIKSPAKSSGGES